MPGLESTRVGGDLATPVEALISRPPLFVEPDATVAETARAMRDAGTSAVLIAGEPLGIVTDRDLRSRVLAADLDPDTPVRAVMSRPLRSLPADTTVFGALLWRFEQGFHHLPLTRGGRIAGVVTDTDLLRHQATSPLALLRRMVAEGVAADGASGPGLGDALARVGRMARHPGLVAVISDFRDAGDWAAPLRRLAALHSVLAVEVRDPREASLPPVGRLALVDPETGRQVEVNTSSERLRSAYAGAERDRREAVASELRRAGAEHVPLDTDRPWLRDLGRWLA